MIFLYILLTLVLLSVLVTVHEGGHFLIARLNGITVNEFSVGMGPIAYSRVSKKSGIRYSIRWLPIGGYVSMAGEDDESDDPNAFCNKNVWRRIATVIAGPAVNILLGLICMILVVAVTPAIGTTVIAETENEYLMVNDKVLKVGYVSVHSANELVYEIMSQGTMPIDLTVERNGETIVLEDVVFPIVEEDGYPFGDADFKVYAGKKTFLNVLSQGATRTLSTVKMVWDSLAGLVTGRFGMDAVSGPIGISETVGSVLNSDGALLNLFYLFTIISVNLGVMNLLPFPALDGGRLIFLFIEAIFRKPLPQKFESYINFAGLAALMLLMILLAVKDIIGLF